MDKIFNNRQNKGNQNILPNNKSHTKQQKGNVQKMRAFTFSMVIALRPSLRLEGQDAYQTKWRTTSDRKYHTFFMDESEQKPTTRPAFNSEGSFQCFGFGYNGFGQISPHKSASKGDEVETFPPRSSVAALTPVPLNVDCVSSVVASWSNTFYLKGRRYCELWFDIQFILEGQ